MVNYQGPKSLRRFVHALRIPIFNRINEISYSVSDLNEIRLGRQEVAKLHDLERILISQNGIWPFDETDVLTAEEMVPPCRLAAVDKSETKISIAVNRGSPLGCCAP